jgi:hypothetical protein
MKIKEYEVLERIGMCIDQLDKDELIELHNLLYGEKITDYIEEFHWHLVPKKGS